jgi:hypothetical protein
MWISRYLLREGGYIRSVTDLTLKYEKNKTVDGKADQLFHVL